MWMDPLGPDPPDPPDPPDNQSNASLVSGAKRRFQGEQNVPGDIKKTMNRDMAVASIQNVYIHPSLVVGIKAYTAMDQGPFLVHISRSEPDPAAGTSIRPIKFGQFLFRNKVQNICPDGVKRVGRNKISVEFKSAGDANSFLDNPILQVNKYEVTIPTFNITKMGVVRNVPVDLSMDEFIESLSLPPGCGTVLKARRFNRKVINDEKISWVPTQTVVLTFQGQLLPARVFSFHTSLPVELYTFPTIQCHHCCRFGHVKSQCRSSPRCYRCAQPHTGESCKVTDSNTSCLHCSGQHIATSKSCPEQGRQKSIKLCMSQQNISYEEASSHFPKVIRPYAEVAQDSSWQVSQSSSLAPPSQSYRKTVTTSPRPSPPLGKSFNRAAHQSIVAEQPSVLPNGCALLSQSNTSPTVQEDGLLELILTMLINLINKNNLNLPSHVAQKLSQIISLTNKYGSGVHSSVEHEKHSSQEA